MISKGTHVRFARFVLLDKLSVPLIGVTMFFLRSMYKKTIIRFVFCDIQNNHGLVGGYQHHAAFGFG